MAKSTPTVPVPVFTIDADAGATLQTREAGAALVRLCQTDLWEDVTNLALDARNDLAERVAKALGNPSARSASVLVDIAVRHVVGGLTPEAVLTLVRSHPELVVEAERLVVEADQLFRSAAEA